jgi:4-hydroxy-tetrahydrodipicolinate reductase
MNFGCFGASGRMGRELAQVAKEAGMVALVGFYRTHEPVGYQRSVKHLDLNQVQDVHCLIDFSLPASVTQHIDFAVMANKPFVSGVTGMGSLEIAQLKKAGESIPVLWSPNFSLGIALFKSLLNSCARLYQYFDFQFEEVHHKKKKDSPSGTVLYLQSELLNLVPNGVTIPDPISIRGGGVVGEHSLRLLGQYESLKIEHTASNRKVFALGALEVSKWLVKQPKGLYTMDDFFKHII